MASVTFNHIDSESVVFHAKYVDTFQVGLNFITPPDFTYRHNPLNLSIVQKTYIKNVSPYKNIMILDYTITNIGSQVIKDSYIGINFDADIYNYAIDTSINVRANLITDDLSGSFREISTAYMFDNDGDLDHDSLFNFFSPLDVIGIRHIKTYPQVLDTNYNWWAHSDLEYGPRKKGTPEKPYRDFGDSVISTPNGDNNKYYILSQPEWDFDQVFTTVSPDDDTTWVKPDSSLALEMADGYDAKMLLSVGPINLIIDDGELLTLLGPSGSGKTTTLSMIAGFINPDEGELLFDENDVTSLPSRERNIGMVVQSVANSTTAHYYYTLGATDGI